jgi:hypothetical protein
MKLTELRILSASYLGELLPQLLAQGCNLTAALVAVGLKHAPLVSDTVHSFTRLVLLPAAILGDDDGTHVFSLLA